MIYIYLFLAFFIPGIVGYGGGPATVPMIQKEVVEHYGWMTNAEYSHMLALGNALPGPITTKIAGYVGFLEGGYIGSFIALFATVAPTTLLMIVLLNVLNKYRDSQRVKRLKAYVLPVVAVQMVQLVFGFFETSIDLSSWMPTILIAVGAYIALFIMKWNTALVILGGLLIGGLLL